MVSTYNAHAHEIMTVVIWCTYNRDNTLSVCGFIIQYARCRLSQDSFNFTQVGQSTSQNVH